VFVTCDARDATEPLAKRHSRLIIKVLSESTEGCDRGAKFGDYRPLESLEEYVLVDSRNRACEVCRRRPEGWLLDPVPEGGSPSDRLHRKRIVTLALYNRRLGVTTTRMP
jgi:Uma2 family endonuclease